MNYLPEDLVLNDFNRFAKAIASDYLVESCVPFKEDSKDSVWLGYEIVHNGHRAIVKMEYLKNNIGELAMKEPRWKIEINNVPQGEGVASLGDVFDYLRIEKRNQKEAQRIQDMFKVLESRKSQAKTVHAWYWTFQSLLSDNVKVTVTTYGVTANDKKEEDAWKELEKSVNFAPKSN